MGLDLGLTNPSGSTITGTLELYNDSGQNLITPFVGIGPQNRIAFTIPGYGVVTLKTTGEGTLVSGFARVTSNGSLGGVIRFMIPGIGIAGVPDSQVVSSGITPVRRAGGINTGLAIADAGGNGTRSGTDAAQFGGNNTRHGQSIACSQRSYGEIH